jgi:hypothetical protein
MASVVIDLMSGPGEVVKLPQKVPSPSGGDPKLW